MAKAGFIIVFFLCWMVFAVLRGTASAARAACRNRKPIAFPRTAYSLISLNYMRT